MRIAITGASGFVGSALVDLLRAEGHTVLRLVRREARAEDEIRWDPAAGDVDLVGLAGVDGVVHLAGENVAGGRWNEARKQRILSSRVDGTRAIAAAMAALDPRPRVLISASAIGLYGDAGARPLDETAPAGDGFLASVCVAWEQAADAARTAGVRVVHPRIGIVLGDGGALDKMLPPFRLGAGGPTGDGRQYMSWIALPDLVRAIAHMLADADITGPVNAVAPHAVPNAVFTKTLGKVLGRPAVIPTPAFALRVAMGRQMADEMLLAGQNVKPAALEAAGFTFDYPELEAALAYAVAA